MSSVSLVTSNSSAASVVSNPNGSVNDRAFAVLVMRYLSYMSDIDAQITSLDRAGQTKRLWNGELDKLNKLLQQVEAQGKGSGELVTVTVKPEDLPYKDYRAVTTADGAVSLEPVDRSSDNWLTSKCTPLTGPAGGGIAVALDERQKLDREIANLSARRSMLTPQGPLATRAVDEQIAALKEKRDHLGPAVVGYELKINAEMIKSQIEVVRGKIDSLNTTNDLDTLRFNDLRSKASLTMEQIAQYTKEGNRTLQKIIENFA